MRAGEFEDLGGRAAGHGWLHLDGVRVPASHLLGGEGEGFVQVMQGFDYSRALISLQCLAVARRSLDETWVSATERTSFGKPLTAHQGVSFPLAEAETHVEACRPPGRASAAARRRRRSPRMVVVTVNYRLGALGFAYLAELGDGLGAGNLGLLDQLTALRWVRDHIAGFGGDPDRVTAAGQSAGAYSIVALLSGASARGLFRQAILQSLPGGMLPQRPAEAARISVLLLDSLGQTDAASLREIPVPDVLAAQQDVARRADLGVAPPFQLVADGELVAADPLRTVGERGADGVRIMLTFTRHEGRAFSPDGDALTERFFLAPGRLFAQLLARHGNPPVWYEFGWSPPGSPFGACHCIELPFVFGTLDAWRDAPMLAGATPAELVALVDDVQARWISFVHEDQNGALPSWRTWPTAT